MTQTRVSDNEALKLASELIEDRRAYSVVQTLTDHGLDRVSAERIYNVAVSTHRARKNKSDLGRLNLKIGMLVFSIGFISTLALWLLSEQNGMYPIFWGTIAFGCIQIFVGLSQITD